MFRLAVAGALVTLLLPSSGSARAASGCRDLSVVPTLASPSDCLTAQPGAGVNIGSTYCTLNFLFRGSDRHTYAGTAGHCAHSVQVGAVATSERGAALGRVVYVENELRIRRDFTLIQLATNVARNPEVEVLGGPHGILRGVTTGPVDAQHIGRGAGLSQAKDARDGVLTPITEPDIAYLLTAASPNDSGSPVLTRDHQAIGWLVALDHKETFTGDAVGVVGGWLVIRVEPAMTRAARALRIKLSLLNAPGA